MKLYYSFKSLRRNPLAVLLIALLMLALTSTALSGCSANSSTNSSSGGSYNSSSTSSNSSSSSNNASGGSGQSGATSSSISNFAIEGKWKNVGQDTFGQAQKGAIIVFDGRNCNFFSPADTYAFYKEGNNYVLDCTSPLADTLSFTVKVLNDDEITISNSSSTVQLKRVG